MSRKRLEEYVGSGGWVVGASRCGRAGLLLEVCYDFLKCCYARQGVGLLVCSLFVACFQVFNARAMLLTRGS